MSATLPQSAVLDSAPGRRPQLRRCAAAAALNVIVANDSAHVNGGAAQVAISSAVGLASRGHHVTFLAGVGPIDPTLERSHLDVVLTGEYDIKSDPKRLRAATRGIWNRRAAVTVRNMLASLDPARTVLHVHGWTKALSSSIVQAAIHEGTPIFVTLHDYFVACPTGGFFNFRTRCACPLRPLSAACLMEHCAHDGYPEKLWRCARQVVQNRFLRAPSPLIRFITLSDLSERILRPFLPQQAHVERVNNPVDLEKEPPVNVAENTRFVALGRLTPEKGLDLLAKAAAQLGCDLACVGEGPSRRDIETIAPGAWVTGWQSRKDVQNHLRAARCLVLPSLWYEAQPLVVLEAAALGVPAIVPDQCAARELVEDGVTGLWFRSGDLVSLRERMGQLQHSQTAARMGHAAYERYWHNPFTLDRHLDALEHCYQERLAVAQPV